MVLFLETPYGRISRRVRTTSAQPSSAFSEKDEDLDEKIRTFRQNMRRRTKKPSEDDEFTFRRENVFNFEAWYRAHFHDDFETKIRDDRKKMYAEQYREQMERISKGLHHIRPPTPFAQHKQKSDIDYQMEEMVEKELRKQILNILQIGLIVIVFGFVGVCIFQKYLDQNIQPYEDPFAKQTTKISSNKTEEK